MALQSKATRMTRQAIVNNGVAGSTALTAEDQMRLEEANDAIQEMNPALRAVFNDLQGNFQTNDSTGITFFYQIGTTFLDVKEDRKGTVYGKGGYRRLCKALDYNVNIADKACVFAKQYDPAEVQAIANLRNNITGKGLTCEHMRHLLVDYLSDSVDPETKLQELKTKRMAYMRRAVEGSWTAKHLKDVIMQENNRESTAGRPTVMTTKNAALQSLSEFHEKGVNSMTKAWLNNEQSIITLLTTNLADVSPDTLALADDALQNMEAYKIMLDELIRQWKQADIHAIYIDKLSGESEADATQHLHPETAELNLDLYEV